MPLRPILPVRYAVARHPTRFAVFYNRCSSRSQAGKGGARLQAKTLAALRSLREVVDTDELVIKEVVSGVEVGKLSGRRRHLIAAAEYAREHDAFLLATDLSRFLRPESFHTKRNPEAWPTPEEFELLRETTGGVLLATIFKPSLSESERRSLATKRTGTAGRPPFRVDHAKFLKVLALWGEPDRPSLTEIGRRVGLEKWEVDKLVRQRVPGRTDDARWKDFGFPLAELHRITADGTLGAS